MHTQQQIAKQYTVTTNKGGFTVTIPKTVSAINKALNAYTQQIKTCKRDSLDWQLYNTHITALYAYKIANGLSNT